MRSQASLFIGHDVTRLRVPVLNIQNLAQTAIRLSDMPTFLSDSPVSSN